LFLRNGEEINSDFKLITNGRESVEIGQNNRISNINAIFAEEGAKVEFATINSNTGPVYIGRNAEIMEGALIRGPFALCEGARVKMGANIYGPSTIGPYCKAGGEITNSLMFAYSNKVHDGYLGNSVIGEWCNVGAGSNTSNLKNSFESAKLRNYSSKKPEDTGLQFCGMFMGDYSKCGINTMFNSGTVIGVCTNLFGAGYHNYYVPSFIKGSPGDYHNADKDNVYDSIERLKKSYGTKFSIDEREILDYVYQHMEGSND